MDIASGLHHIHSNGLVHMDIKPQVRRVASGLVHCFALLCLVSSARGPCLRGEPCLTTTRGPPSRCRLRLTYCSFVSPVTSLLSLCPKNIFLTQDGTLKIGDLGMVREAGSVEDGHEGDHVYMAKELLDSNAKTTSADIFSFGITLHEVTTGLEPPLDGPAWHRMRDGHPPEPMPSLRRSEDLWALILQLMSPDPRDRPFASEILRHPRVEAAATGAPATLCALCACECFATATVKGGFVAFGGAACPNTETDHGHIAAFCSALLSPLRRRRQLCNCCSRLVGNTRPNCRVAGLLLP